MPLLYEPAEFEAQPKDAAGSSSAPIARAPSVLDALHGLSQQCTVFKKSAEQLGKSVLLFAGLDQQCRGVMVMHLCKMLAVFKNGAWQLA